MAGAGGAGVLDATDLCDVVYALLLEQIAQQVQAERQVAAVFLAAGAKNIEMPTYEAARVRFDEALRAEPQAVDRERDELLRALGVR